MDNYLLILGAMIGGTISGLTGMGGGSLLLVIMSTVMGPPVLIPAHALVQVGSNFSRTFAYYKKLDLKIITRYLIGAFIGAGIGYFFRIDLSPELLSFCIGAFILFTTWVPFQKLFQNRVGLLGSKIKYHVLGSVSTVLALFVGVTGPLVHPIIMKEKHLDRFGFIGTEATCMGITHVMKIAVFATWGVGLKDYIGVLALMIPATFLGNLFAHRILKKMTDHHFKKIVKVIVTILAIRLVYQSFL
jgi:uncharacterized membrane protein YfcA